MPFPIGRFLSLAPFVQHPNRNLIVRRAPSEDLKTARGSIVFPCWLLNVIRAYSEDFSTRLGQPCPVLKCKQGLERVEGEAVKNFDLM